MKDRRILVKWSYTDNYGRPRGYSRTWFNTREEAENFVAEKKKKNGGYFYLYEIKEADYADYILMLSLEKQIKKLEELL